MIVGGYNVYPREVDEVLYLHADVAQAAAVGWPDSYRGEVIRAFVLRPGASADEVRALPGQPGALKVPAVIEILTRCPAPAPTRSTRRRCAPRLTPPQARRQATGKAATDRPAPARKVARMPAASACGGAASKSCAPAPQANTAPSPMRR